SNLQIGPVDWAAVLRSPTLLRTAWWLSDDPRRASNFQRSVEGINVALNGPFEYSDGNMQCHLVVTNRGANAFILPPFALRGVLLDHDACHEDAVWVEPQPFLRRGVSVLRPGEEAVCTLSIPAPPRPWDSSIVVRLFGRPVYFRVHVCDRAGEGTSLYSDWSN